MSEKLLAHPAALVNRLRAIAIAAGDITLDYFDESGFLNVSAKSDGSPVTEADRLAEAHIEKELTALFPAVPFIGEEAVEEGRIPGLDGADYFWLVDALDGTREFVAGSGDYTVNIALLKKQDAEWLPLIGVVYAPVKGVLYSGHGAGTAMRVNVDTGTEKQIRVRRAPREGLTVVASKHHGDTSKRDRFLEEFKVAKLLKVGSSLKICAIAEGKADLYPRFGPTSEWDIAAAQTVLESAGGFIVAESGSPLVYGGADRRFLNPPFIASGEKYDFS